MPIWVVLIIPARDVTGGCTYSLFSLSASSLPWFPSGEARAKSDSLWVQAREPEGLCGSELKRVNLKGVCQKITQYKVLTSTPYA